MTYYARFVDGVDVKQVNKDDALAWGEEHGVDIDLSIKEEEVV